MGELIGYARCSTVLQDLTAQRQALAALGVPDDRVSGPSPSTGTGGRFLAWSGEFVHLGRVTVHEVVAPGCIEPLSGVLWDGPADPRGLIFIGEA
jgi:hypothetical protein